jgi:hypothetical protein
VLAIGNAVRDDDGKVIKVVPDARRQLTYLHAAEKFTIDRTRFDGYRASDRVEPKESPADGYVIEVSTVESGHVG